MATSLKKRFEGNEEVVIRVVEECGDTAAMRVLGIKDFVAFSGYLAYLKESDGLVPVRRHHLGSASGGGGDLAKDLLDHILHKIRALESGLELAERQREKALKERDEALLLVASRKDDHNMRLMPQVDEILRACSVKE